jgi:glycosyltransferase involved in cell wall biosynthesis
METCGMVTMEAALADCNVVCSTAGFELEYYRNLAYYCDPGDIGSIRDAVTTAYEHYDRDAERRLALKRHILDSYTWPKVAEALFHVYRNVLEHHNSVPVV